MGKEISAFRSLRVLPWGISLALSHATTVEDSRWNILTTTTLRVFFSRHASFIASFYREKAETRLSQLASAKSPSLNTEGKPQSFTHTHRVHAHTLTQTQPCCFPPCLLRWIAQRIKMLTRFCFSQDTGSFNLKGTVLERSHPLLVCNGRVLFLSFSCKDF